MEKTIKVGDTGISILIDDDKKRYFIFTDESYHSFASISRPNDIEVFIEAISPKPTHNDNACAERYLSDDSGACQTNEVERLAQIIAAHRTAAEKKARDEAFKEALQYAGEFVTQCNSSGIPIVAAAILAIYNPYKKDK